MSPTGDFNEVDLPRADLFLLAKIVHDWNPPQITSLLSRVYASLSDGEGSPLNVFSS